MFWMDVPECRGFEAHVLRCTHLFRAARGPCRSRPLRVACRNFTIAAAGEAGPDPAAGAPPCIPRAAVFFLLCVE